MKTILIVAGLALSALFCNAQNTAVIKAGEEVKIDWNLGPALFFLDGYWEATYAIIAREVGEEKAKLIKEYPSFRHWPAAMWPNATDSVTREKYNERLNKLHVIKVMTLTYQLNGKTHTSEIVEVPYHLNKDWNPAVKWDHMFAIVDPQYVKKINTKTTN